MFKQICILPDNLHTFVILSAKIFKALLDNKTNIMNWVLVRERSQIYLAANKVFKSRQEGL